VLSADITLTGLPLGLLGRQASVTVRNDPDAGSASGWTVVVSLPAGQDVTNVSGAQYSGSGSQAIFTGGGLGPGDSTSFSFDLPGLLGSAPVGCTIDGRACD
jgi:hypothetical protein